jgi:hypothetical protein
LEGIDVYFDARTYRSGDVLFRRGEAADEVYFVQAGQVLSLPFALIHSLADCIGCVGIVILANA